MGMPFDDDDDDEARDNVLKGLGDEVDDYAGQQLPEDAKGAGITLEITIKPKMAGQDPTADQGMGGGDDGDIPPGHDPVAHMLGACKEGMCGGGMSA